MVTSLVSSVFRVLLTWYIVGILFIFLGDPKTAESLYTNLSVFSWVPMVEFAGIWSAWKIQLNLLIYWTIPTALIWAITLASSFLVAQGYVEYKSRSQGSELKPQGKFYGVYVPAYSLGRLPAATVPGLEGDPVYFVGPNIPVSEKVGIPVKVGGNVAQVLSWMDEGERQLCAELVQVLMAQPNHYAGAGHGVGLLEHTLNVASEVAARCTPEFRLPFVAALAHDVGKLITFKQAEDGSWVRRGFHSRESSRILATLPAFASMAEDTQRALILAIQYDHAPQKMPQLRGEKGPSMLALRIISALSAADQTATAQEKERNLEQLQPEDILWHDFLSNLPEVPMVDKGGKKGAVNQLNYPPNSPYLYVYELAWREGAIRRMPEEIAAALDLTRRDTGKLAKYTKLLAERLRREGVLLEEFESMRVSEDNPLWDVQTGIKKDETPMVIRGVLVIKAEELWQKSNMRLRPRPTFQPVILAPNSNPDGSARTPKKAEKVGPEVVESVKIQDLGAVQSAEAPKRRAFGDEKPKASQEQLPLLGALDAAPKALSASEVKEGLLIADAAAIEIYPNLVVGDVYYGPQAPMVQQGVLTAGTFSRKGPVPANAPSAVLAASSTPASEVAESIASEAEASPKNNAPVVTEPSPAEQSLAISDPAVAPESQIPEKSAGANLSAEPRQTPVHQPPEPNKESVKPKEERKPKHEDLSKKPDPKLNLAQPGPTKRVVW